MFAICVQYFNKSCWDRTHIFLLNLSFFYLPSCRLILQMDENHALKSALQSSMKAKGEDLKLYHAMMKQTKEVFLQGLRQFKQTNQNS